MRFPTQFITKEHNSIGISVNIEADLAYVFRFPYKSIPTAPEDL